MQALAKETGVVLVVPMYEEETMPGIYYNTAAVIDADGAYLGKYRKTHIPHVTGFWEKFYFGRATWAIRFSTRRWARLASTSAMTGISPRVPGPWA